MEVYIRRKEREKEEGKRKKGKREGEGIVGEMKYVN